MMKEKIFFADYLKFCDFSDFSKSIGYAGSNGTSREFMSNPCFGRLHRCIKEKYAESL